MDNPFTLYVAAEFVLRASGPWAEHELTQEQAVVCQRFAAAFGVAMHRFLTSRAPQYIVVEEEQYLVRSRGREGFHLDTTVCVIQTSLTRTRDHSISITMC
jgi:hypothetical protein